jgi:hypothetical protein
MHKWHGVSLCVLISGTGGGLGRQQQQVASGTRSEGLKREGDAHEAGATARLLYTDVILDQTQGTRQ